jgi:uncharacterized protein YhhL (DUF1145 family)
VAKWGVIVAWVFGFGAPLLAPGSSAAVVGGWLLGILVVAHAVECVVFLPRLRRAPGSLPGHLLRTFVFGILHVRELEPTR